MAIKVAVLLLGGLEVILGPGGFMVFDFPKMSVPLFWKELARVMDLGNRWSDSGWRSVLPVPPASPSTSKWMP
eukprot:1139909-Pelagomonas_calceolata.AAC.2